MYIRHCRKNWISGDLHEDCSNNDCALTDFGGVAQLVEQSFRKGQVAGSIPCRHHHSAAREKSLGGFFVPAASVSHDA